MFTTATNRLIRSAAIVASLGAVAGAASAQTGPYNRRLLRQSVSFAPSPLGPGYAVSASSRMSNGTADPLDLSFTVVVVVNGGTQTGGPVLIPNVMTGQLGAPCQGSCGGGCNGLEAMTCAAQDGGGCLCLMPADMVVPGPLHLVAGDVVTVSIFAAPGAVPEIDVSDDSVQAVFWGSCPADVNGDGHITPADVAVFVSRWFTSVQNGTLAGDFNGNGSVSPADVAAFVSAWSVALTTGC